MREQDANADYSLKMLTAIVYTTEYRDKYRDRANDTITRAGRF